MTTRTISPAIAALAVDITSIVRTGDPAPVEVGRQVAVALAGRLADPDLLRPDQREPAPEAYRTHVLYVDPDGEFSITSVVWRPGQSTVIHDHVAWCVVGVYVGTEEETVYRLVDGAYLVPAGHLVNREGTAGYFAPPGDIHSVRNAGDGTVISIHVYGADIAALGSSIRRVYDLPVREA
jgi:3-mercaptopropionate dioxygenase